MRNRPKKIMTWFLEIFNFSIIFITCLDDQGLYNKLWIGYNIGIELADNMSLIFKGRKTFTLDSNGNYNAVKNTQIETLIYF